MIRSIHQSLFCLLRASGRLERGSWNLIGRLTIAKVYQKVIVMITSENIYFVESTLKTNWRQPVVQLSRNLLHSRSAMSKLNIFRSSWDHNLSAEITIKILRSQLIYWDHNCHPEITMKMFFLAKMMKYGWNWRNHRMHLVLQVFQVLLNKFILVGSG